MSYLGTFYRDFANDGAAHLADLYETLVEAASWIEHAVEAHYGPAKEPYRFEQMPGYALGLRPLEIQVHKKTNSLHFLMGVIAKVATVLFGMSRRLHISPCTAAKAAPRKSPTI